MGIFKKLFGKKKKKEDIEENINDKDNILIDEATNKEINKEEEKEQKQEEKQEEKVEDVPEKKDEEINIPEEHEEKKGKKNLFKSLKDKLFRTREGFFGKIKNIFSGRDVIDDEMYEELEELLIQSDIGMDMTVKIVSSLEKEAKKRGLKKPEEIYEVLREVMGNFLIKENNDLNIIDGELNVILVVGVNGVGKTTTIGKIANQLKKEGKKVMIGAADTFRAAAIEQLEEWGKRAGVEIVSKEQGSDPGSVVYETISKAQEKKADVVIIDTAGRLHNKANLMKELEKINNIIIKKIGHERYESILVLDGTTGQNGLSQAEIFNESTKLTGFIVTKLDGTAKGGVIFSISDKIKKPIKYIGVGESIEDLRKFNAKEYIDAIFD